MKLFTVILHYGQLARTARLHSQLLESDPGEHDRIMVFDNCAVEPYPEAWFRSGRNLYWSGAFEHTLAVMAEQGATHVWFLNNDLYFMTKAPIIGKVRERLLWAERMIGPVAVYSPSVTSNPYHPQMVRRAGGQLRRVHYVDGIAPLVSIEYWLRAGGLDCGGNPYGYGVDVWFSIQAEKYGFSCVVDHQIFMRHRYHSTAKEVDGFIEMAAKAENDYLTQRVGPNYKIFLSDIAKDFQEIM